MYKKTSLELLHKSLIYNPRTGKFIRKIPDNARPSHISQYDGKPTFTQIHASGYYVGGVGGDQYLAHRVAWAMHYGQWPEGQIDHIDHDRLNNRIDNLRVVSDAENKKNLSLRNGSKSGTPGVTWRKDRQRWRSRIKTKDREVFLGNYHNLEDAIRARKLAEKKYGFHPNHGKEQL